MAASGEEWEDGCSVLKFGQAGDTTGPNTGAEIPEGDFVIEFDEENEEVEAVFTGWNTIKSKMGNNSGTNWNTAYYPWVDLVANHFGMTFTHWNDGETHFKLKYYRNLFDNLKGVYLNKNWLDDNHKTDLKDLLTETITFEKHFGKLYVKVNWDNLDSNDLEASLCSSSEQVAAWVYEDLSEFDLSSYVCAFIPDFWDDFRADIMADFNPMTIKTIDSDYEDRSRFTQVFDEMIDWNVVFF